jgi:DNA polymerase elongation subunit (family B)
MKMNFIPIDYDYFDFEGRNYAKVVGRNEKGKRICIIDSCPIFFWAILKENLADEKIKKLIEKIKKIKLDVKGRQTKVEEVEIHDKNFLGKKVKALKIFATNYKDLHDIAGHLGLKEIEKRRGYDLGFVTHYIKEEKLAPMNWYEISGDMIDDTNDFGGISKSLDVDMCIKLEKATPHGVGSRVGIDFKPKVLAYDIETDELKIGEGEILMISLVSDNFKKVITWKKSKISQNNNKPIGVGSRVGTTSKDVGTTPVEFVKDEAELLEKFQEYVKEISPDFLVGYFSDGFDLPYLKARADVNKIKLSLGLDGSQPKFSRGMNLTGKINGIVHVDILKFIRTAYAQYMKSETLSLNEVAKEFLGDTKKPFEHKHSSKIKHNEWETYYEYNLHDSILTLGLFDKFWPDMLEFSKTIQEPIFEISRAGLSKYVESYILHNLEKFNEIPEKRPGYDEIGERRSSGGVEGAFVYSPTPGLYENIAMFDFTSMHTSIIITHNLSKGTLLEKKEKNSNESPELELGGKKTQFYFSKKPGFFPELLNEIFNKRKKFKEEYKKNPNVITKARSNAFKVLSASVHGYIGFFGARYYSIESSASILAFVRKYNIDTIEKIKKQGHEIIYGDTDSIAFLTNGKSEAEIKKLLKKLNSELPGLMEMELEDFYKRGLWVSTRSGKTGAKKKYAMIDSKGELKIRGFETVRRDWCGLARQIQNDVIKMILEKGNEKQALEYLKKIIKKVKNREINKKDLIIKTQLKKPISEYKAISPHVVAAKRMKEQEIPISQGNIIEYYIAEGQNKKALVRDRVKLPDEKGEYDIEYYLKHQILPSVENILQVFNINITEIIEGKKQMTLGDF